MQKSGWKNTQNLVILKPHRVAFKDWLEDLAAIPKEEQKQWIKDTLRPKHMLHIFGQYFFPHFIKSETAECHLDLIEELTAPKDSGIIFPRGFAKTTWEKIDTIHDMVYELEPVILYVCSTYADAQLHLEHIKLEFESNDLIIDVYGNLAHPTGKRSYRWNLRRLQTSAGINLVARGRGKGRGVNINGQRPTKIIIDDVEDDQQVSVPEQRAKLHKWLYNVVFPSKDSIRGKIKMIGTVLSPLCEVLAFYKAHGGIFRKAIENGESIWPGGFTLEKLEELKSQIGSRAFAQEYLNTPVNDELSIIKAEWLEKSYYSEPLNPTLLQTVIMLDPQAGEKKTSDSYGICVLGFYPKDRHRYVLEIKSGKGTQLNQAAELIRTWLQYPRSFTVGCEKILSQVAVYQNILEWKSGLKIFDPDKFPDLQDISRNMPFKKVEPRGRDGGILKDKKARLQMHEAAIERGELHLHVGMKSFAEKLVSFPEVEHDDDIDALIYCLDESYGNGLSTAPKKEHNKNRKSSAIVGDILEEKF